MPNPVELRGDSCRQCCCPCRYPHPRRCPRCGSRDSLIHRAGGFLGCPACGLWAYELRDGDWGALHWEQVPVRYPRKHRLHKDDLTLDDDDWALLLKD